ncbi:MAG: hypothetical protein KI791_12735 [Cyclobacteriaceae bacterium]|nr:hypothetical protein [Cyclobacteriaceae bacterium SS2]
MKIVVDSNIVFSALLNADSSIARLFFYPQKPVDFFTCDFLKEEIELHSEKLKKISGLTDRDLNLSKSKLFDRIRFIDYKLINDQSWEKAETLVADIDPDDVSFVALALDFSNSYLWTGDKKLRAGLKQRGFKQIINTRELMKLIEKLDE